MTATDHQLELLNDAHQAWLYAADKVSRGDLSAVAVEAEIRAINILLDRCIDCGMPHDEPDHEGWAAIRLARWLVEA